MMRVLTAAAAILFLGTDTAVAGPADGIAAGLIFGGAVAVALSFNYKFDQCPSGYRVHTSDRRSTRCSRITDVGSDFRDATTAVRLARKELLIGGIAAAAIGAVVLLIPEARPLASVDIRIDPGGGWSAAKTFAW